MRDLQPAESKGRVLDPPLCSAISPGESGASTTYRTGLDVGTPQPSQVLGTQEGVT
jgi:hypothetical protein